MKRNNSINMDITRNITMARYKKHNKVVEFVVNILSATLILVIVWVLLVVILSL